MHSLFARQYHQLLGSRFGVLMMEVTESPVSLLTPLVGPAHRATPLLPLPAQHTTPPLPSPFPPRQLRLLRGAIDLCNGDFTLFVPVLLFTVRISIRIRSFFALAFSHKERMELRRYRAGAYIFIRIYTCTHTHTHTHA